MNKDSFLAYKSLLKPGIIRSNTLIAVAGYFLAAGLHPDFITVIGIIIGMALIISSACIFNNYYDRDIDKKMKRTENRPFVTGTVDTRTALIFATILLLMGVLSMALLTNVLALSFGILGFVSYVFAYTPLKKRSVHGTLVGAIPGATPPAAGYVAFTGQLDIAPLILILILFFWQMPHFFAIALFRLEDYKKAKVPVLPLKNGVAITKLFIMLYIVGLTISCILLTLLGYAGWSFLVVMTALNVVWFIKGALNYSKLEAKLWGKKMFLFSLLIITSLSLMFALGNILP